MVKKSFEFQREVSGKTNKTNDKVVLGVLHINVLKTKHPSSGWNNLNIRSKTAVAFKRFGETKEQ